jgi:hypothetical protein
MLHLRTINQTTEPRSQTNLIWQKSELRQLVRLPWAADSCPWVGRLRTVLPLKGVMGCEKNGLGRKGWVGTVLADSKTKSG